MVVINTFENGLLNLMVDIPFEDMEERCLDMPEYQRICHDVGLKEELHRRRVLKYMPDLARFKEPARTWYEFEGLIRSLWNSEYTVELADELAEEGQLIALKILSLLPMPVYISKHGLLVALEAGRDSVVKWAMEYGQFNGTLSLQDIETLLVTAVQKDNINMVEFIWDSAEGFQRSLRQGFGEAILRSGKFLYIRLLLRKGVIQGSIEDANQLVYSGDLSRRDDFSEGKDLRLLKWFAARYAFPDEDGANIALATDNIPVLDWLGSQDILPTSIAARRKLRGIVSPQVRRWINDNILL